MPIIPRGSVLFALVILCASLLATDQSQAAVEQYTKGVTKDGIALVSARFISRAFAADLRWAGDVRSLLLTYKQKSVHLSFDSNLSDFDVLPTTEPIIYLPATPFDGEAFVPLVEISAALDATIAFDVPNETAVVTRDDTTLIVDLSSKWALSREATRKDPIVLPVYQFIPSSDPASYDTELDSTTKETAIPINLKTTALVVIDFWGDTLIDNPFYDNTASLIYLARKHGIPVIHAPHEGLGLPGYRVNPRILPIPDNEPVLTTETLEGYFAKNNMTIDTLIYTGYGTAECLLYTKADSINNVARRSKQFKIILMKDATTAPYWAYLFAVNGIETKFLSSTLNNLSKALGDDIRAVEAVPSGYYSDPVAYQMDSSFGLDLDFRTTALMLVNIWDYDDNDGWLKRIKYNTRNHILPLVQFARAKGMKIVHVSNGRRLDPSLKRGSDEPELKSRDEVRQYISDNRITTLVYAGNLINTTDLFPPIDVWGFTGDSSFPVSSRLLEDCLNVFETRESLAHQQFKKVFLERAVAYLGARHAVTSFSILRRNARLQVIQPNAKVEVPAEDVREGRFLRIVASSAGAERSGEIVIAGHKNRLVIPSGTVRGTADLVFSDWGKGHAEFHIVGAKKLLSESEGGGEWRRGYQDVVYSDKADGNLVFRFDGVYPIRKGMVRLDARNWADHDDMRAGMSFSCDGGKTYRDLEEKRTTYEDGKFTWYLRDMAPGCKAVIIRVNVYPMSDHIGIESLRISLDLKADKIEGFDKDPLWIGNGTKSPIRVDIVKAGKLKEAPLSRLR